MKNLITSMACIALLLAFVLQFTQNQVIYNHITSVDQAINNFKEIAKQEGYISDRNISNLKDEITSAIGCDVYSIHVSGTKNKVKRGSIIEYSVSVPIEGIISTPGFWGISKEENMSMYIVNRYTTSEYLDRVL